MKGERKRNAAIGFAAVLIFSVALFYLAVLRKPSATIQFSEAEFSTNGTLAVQYNNTASWGSAWGASLHETQFVGSKKTGQGTWTSSSGGSYSGKLNVDLQPSEIPHPIPSMLVTTGQKYHLKPHEQLPIYNFTNNSGVIYHAEISLECSRK